MVCRKRLWCPNITQTIREFIDFENNKGYNAYKMLGGLFHKTWVRSFYNNLIYNWAVKYMRDNKAKLDFY